MMRHLCIVIACAFLTTGCTPNQKSQKLSKKRIVIGINSEPDTLNPLFAEMAASFEVLSLGYRWLTQYDDGWNLVADLAEAVPTLKNGLVKLVGNKMEVTWTIRKDAAWEDGVPVTADDAIFAQTVCLDETQEIIDRDICQRIESIKVMSTDRKTFLVTWKKTFAFMNRYRVHPLLPAHILKARYFKANGEKANLKKDSFGIKPLSNGPYKFKEWIPGQYITYVRNEGYKPRAFADEITFQIIPNNQALESNLIAGTIDAAAPSDGLNVPQIESVRAREANKFKYTYVAGMVWAHIDFNLDNPLLKDVRVRRAIAHGVNRQKIIDTIYYGKYERADSFLPPKHWGYDATLPKIDFNLQKAAQLLDEAGFQQKGVGSIRENAKGEKLSIKIMAVAGIRDLEQFEQIMQSDLRSIGVDITIENKPAKVFFGDLARHRKIPQLALYSWVSDPGDWSETLWHQNMIPSQKNQWQGQNYPGWKNTEASELLDVIPTILDLTKRQALMRRVQELWLQDLPAMPLFFRPVVTIARPDLQNFRPTGTQTPVTWNAEQWQIAK